MSKSKGITAIRWPYRMVFYRRRRFLGCAISCINLIAKISNIGEKLPWTTLAKARRELDKAITDSRFSGMEDQFKKIDNFLNNIEKKFL